MCNSCGGKSNHRPIRRKASRKKQDKCPESEAKNEEPPKCPNKKRLPPKPKKCLTKIEKIMMRIQPSIADRERYLHPEHVNCFLEESEIVYLKKPVYDFHPTQRPKVCAEDKKNKTKQMSNYDVEDREIKDREIKEEKKEKKEDKEKDDDGSNAVENQVEDNTKTEGNMKKLDLEKTKRHVKTNKKKKKLKKLRKRDIEEDSDSELSICSIDSEVCLVGLGLTKEDKKTIEENRRKVHPPPDNEDKTVKGDDNVTDATEQGDNQAEAGELRNEDE